MEAVLGNPIWLLCAFVIGACIGSFLNVVIYRVPLGMSVSEPRRSFCPRCKKEIPWYRNVPILTWILQRGKCAECGAPIAFRYVLVELLTAVLFLAAWWVFVTEQTPVAPLAAALVAVLVVLLISISFIDAEHMVVPVTFCYVGMGIAVLGSALDPTLVMLADASSEEVWWRGALGSLLGIAAGWGGLSIVVILGKFFLGEKRINFEQPAEWYLREPESDQEELSFVLKEGEQEEVLGWSDIFYRASDRLEIEGSGVLVDGERKKGASLVISREAVTIGDETFAIEKMVSLSGKADKLVIPREAMGAGDPPLLGLIGAFIGWKGVIFALFASCIFALVWAVAGRIGFGRQLPFGPFLALGGVTWIFGGWMIWEWYFSTLAGFGPPPAQP